jgi:molecular chaperone GrpE
VKDRKDEHRDSRTGGQAGGGADPVLDGEAGAGPQAGAGVAAELEAATVEETGVEETGVEPTPDPIAALEAELAQARAEAQGFRDSWYRTAADWENFRRRSARELAEGQERARAEVLLSLIQVLDDVERALAASGAAGGAAGAAGAAGDEGDVDPIVTGLRMIRGRLTDALRRHGVTEIPADAALFDPHVHEAVMQVAHDAVPGGHVVEVLERGYSLGERVLRPARVIVAMERS